MSWLQTRESSTLVIATFLASASLLLLSVPDSILQIPYTAQIGLWFAVIGLAYRQITTWTIDRTQHNREVQLARMYVDNINIDDALRQTVRRIIQGEDLGQENNELVARYVQEVREHPELERNVEILHNRNSDNIYIRTAGIREFFVLWFLSMPIAIWPLVACCNSDTNLSWWILIFIGIAAAIAGCLTAEDLRLRRRDRQCFH